MATGDPDMAVPSLPEEVFRRMLTVEEFVDISVIGITTIADPQVIDPIVYVPPDTETENKQVGDVWTVYVHAPDEENGLPN